jgi:hypothetical protein
MKHFLLLGVLAAATGCDESLVPQPLPTTSFTATTVGTSEELSALPSFADERGGGVFVDLAGRVTRVRPNGTRGVLEPHPSDEIWPGPATGVFPLSGINSLVATSRGVFVVNDGWLVSPEWQAVIPPDGLRASAVSSDGSAWLAHDTGLFRLARGTLGEFKLGDQSLGGVTSVAAAPTPEGGAGIWFIREKKLFTATQTGTDDFSVKEVKLDASISKDGYLAVVGLSPSPKSAGELWVITPNALLTFTGLAWLQFKLDASPRVLKGAGRFAWMQAGNTLYRLDGDLGAWQTVEGLSASATLLGCDSAGTAWVRVGEETVAVAPYVPLRLRGMFASQQIFDGQLVLQAAVPSPSRDDAGVVTGGETTAMSWQLDDLEAHNVDLTAGADGEGPTEGETFYSLAGIDGSQVLKPVSFAALNDGWHTLSVKATVGGQERSRKLHFLFSGAANAVVSWEDDVRPIFEARCASCHVSGPAPTELKNFTEWKANSSNIADRVRSSAMPPGGMDPTSVSTIVRWVNGGTLP